MPSKRSEALKREQEAASRLSVLESIDKKLGLIMERLEIGEAGDVPDKPLVLIPAVAESLVEPSGDDEDKKSVPDEWKTIAESPNVTLAPDEDSD